ncbi:MAG: methanogenesis marker 8 protein [Candidatus Bathycorpusculaceae bacterium]
MCVKGEHEIYCCGARVRVTKKSIEVLSEPMIEHCPLHEAIYGTKRIDVEAVKKSVEMKVAGFGFCCENRVFDAEPLVPYGASEMMQFWLDNGLVDCAVIVCEGAGTVIAKSGKLVQAIGARLTGIIRTSPIPKIIEHIEAEGGVVLDKTSAKIDQVEGVRQAFTLGFKRVAVSVAGFQAKTISEIRKFEAETKADVLVFSVCNTCVGNHAVEHIAKADVACASASKILRNEIGGKALMQLGMTIPVYVLTERGKKLVLAYLAEFKDKLVIFRTGSLPYLAENRGPKLKGKFE